MASVGVVSIGRATGEITRAHCARTMADAVALAVVAHGEGIAAEFARQIDARLDIHDTSPVVVLVSSRCGTAMSAADTDGP